MTSADWDRRHEAAATERWDDAARYLDDVAGRGPGKALDLACGTGGAAAWLVRHGWTVTGVDFSPVALAIAKERAPGVTWVEADLLTWRAVPEAFDLVHTAYLHLPESDLRTVVTMAAQALGPGGRIVVVGHDVTNATEGVGGPANTAVLHEPKRLASWLAGEGLVVDIARTQARPVAGESRLALDSVVVAHREGTQE